MHYKQSQQIFEDIIKKVKVVSEYIVEVNRKVENLFKIRKLQSKDLGVLTRLSKGRIGCLKFLYFRKYHCTMAGTGAGWSGLNRQCL